jgi:hypothetical protein
MSGEEWVLAKDAFERMRGQSDDPGAFLLRLARNGGVKTRASSVNWGAEQQEWGGFRARKSGELKPHFWNAVCQKGWMDWKHGSFGFDEAAPSEVFGVGETLHWTAKDIEFNWLQVLQQFEQVSDAPPYMRSVLPPHAKTNDYHYEEAAHQAAQFVREQHIKPGTAFTKIVETYPRKVGTLESAVRAMRQTYNLMYDERGKPHPK